MEKVQKVHDLFYRQVLKNYFGQEEKPEPWTQSLLNWTESGISVYSKNRGNDLNKNINCIFSFFFCLTKQFHLWMHSNQTYAVYNIKTKNQLFFTSLLINANSFAKGLSAVFETETFLLYTQLSEKQSLIKSKSQRLSFGSSRTEETPDFPHMNRMTTLVLYFCHLSSYNIYLLGVTVSWVTPADDIKELVFSLQTRRQTGCCGTINLWKAFIQICLKNANQIHT